MNKTIVIIFMLQSFFSAFTQAAECTYKVNGISINEKVNPVLESKGYRYDEQSSNLLIVNYNRCLETKLSFFPWNLVRGYGKALCEVSLFILDASGARIISGKPYVAKVLATRADPSKAVDRTTISQKIAQIKSAKSFPACP